MYTYVCAYFLYAPGKLIVNRYIAESITMIAGRFGHVGLVNCIQNSSPDINKVAMSLYDIINLSHVVCMCILLIPTRLV